MNFHFTVDKAFFEQVIRYGYRQKSIVHPLFQKNTFVFIYLTDCTASTELIQLPSADFLSIICNIIIFGFVCHRVEKVVRVKKQIACKLLVHGIQYTVYCKPYISLFFLVRRKYALFRYQKKLCQQTNFINCFMSN
jgi:hypothetical protein